MKNVKNNTSIKKLISLNGHFNKSFSKLIQTKQLRGGIKNNKEQNLQGRYPLFAGAEAAEGTQLYQLTRKITDTNKIKSTICLDMKHDRVDPDWFHNIIGRFDFNPNDDRVIKESECPNSQDESIIVLDLFALLYKPISHHLIEDQYKNRGDIVLIRDFFKGCYLTGFSNFIDSAGSSSLPFLTKNSNSDKFSEKMNEHTHSIYLDKLLCKIFEREEPIHDTDNKAWKTLHVYIMDRFWQRCCNYLISQIEEDPIVNPSAVRGQSEQYKISIQAIDYLRSISFVDFKEIDTKKLVAPKKVFYACPIVALPYYNEHEEFEISQSACAKAMRENGCQNTYVSQRAEKQNPTVTKFFEALQSSISVYISEQSFNEKSPQFINDVKQTIYSFLKYIGDTSHIVLSKLIKESKIEPKPKPIMLISERPLLARCMQEKIDFYSTQQKVLESVAPIGGSDVYRVERLDIGQIQAALNEKINEKQNLLYEYYKKTFGKESSPELDLTFPNAPEAPEAAAAAAAIKKQLKYVSVFEKYIMNHITYANFMYNFTNDVFIKNLTHLIKVIDKDCPSKFKRSRRKASFGDRATGAGNYAYYELFTKLNSKKFLEAIHVVSNDIFRPFINMFEMWSSLKLGYENDSLIYDIFDDIGAKTEYMESIELIIKKDINKFLLNYDDSPIRELAAAADADAYEMEENHLPSPPFNRKAFYTHAVFYVPDILKSFCETFVTMDIQSQQDLGDTITNAAMLYHNRGGDFTLNESRNIDMLSKFLHELQIIKGYITEYYYNAENHGISIQLYKYIKNRAIQIIKDDKNTTDQIVINDFNTIYAEMNLYLTISNFKNMHGSGGAMKRSRENSQHENQGSSVGSHSLTNEDGEGGVEQETGTRGTDLFKSIKLTVDDIGVIEQTINNYYIEHLNKEDQGFDEIMHGIIVDSLDYSYEEQEIHSYLENTAAAAAEEQQEMGKTKLERPETPPPPPKKIRGTPTKPTGPNRLASFSPKSQNSSSKMLVFNKQNVYGQGD